ncbi:ABC transporter substrate-binding protein [Paenibacillus sp. HWE-109]|uniref:ABC transporter substrate-binding protein n=1 Tax=Paenibacillus sp. HWE-109 TaxID=1306526 RepID=UPI001EDF60DD|nr:ABC transporter substrate-binding protein [Paenibacillus sp. HWE-109]UKS25142.1 ABC transporter substrate-binding protein [Paenibacillus sp. HWE-109]
MKRSIQWIAGIASILFLLASTACAATKTEPNQVSSSPAASNQTTKVVTDKQRVVKSSKGDVKIPDEPKKVIGLSVVYPEFLYALGVTPIAVQNYHPEFPSYLKEPFKYTVKTGLAQTPNFEAILATEPDLIIAPTWWSDKDYEQLSKIAPTVLLPQRDNWRDELKDIGEVLGKKTLAEKVIQDLQNKEVDAKEKLHALVGNETVMYMMIMAKELVVYGENIDRGSFIHKELGLKPVKDFPQSEQSVSISLEKIPDFNPDHIILQLDDESSDEVQKRYKALLESSLWKNMTAVKNNHVYIMGGKEWFSLGMSPLADSNAVDDVLRAFNKNAK